jgi:hypothetical protein
VAHPVPMGQFRTRGFAITKNHLNGGIEEGYGLGILVGRQRRLPTMQIRAVEPQPTCS